ncbi:OsmC family protein [Peptococcaceae bacterium]|nr:OsmC family protein [Desulfotomaculum sp.]MCL0043662.1 OsmC family protein [Peptococcaceae bacterium]MCL0077808.1 OsmC family protein [Peptococcaceae bacterium]MCL0100775.1 OsmC family protein [Peptococcaceae bacterium]MCL0106448.1 OsmC family protein [Peptococcaceae bacterium]
MHKVDIKWQGKRKFKATDEDGHIVEMDAPEAIGGENSAVSPLKLMLMSLAGCSGVDIISFLESIPVKVEEFKIEVNGVRADSAPQVYKKINVVYKLKGDIPVDKVEDALKLSIEKYCSAAHMINKVADISYSYEVNGELYQYK